MTLMIQSSQLADILATVCEDENCNVVKPKHYCLVESSAGLQRADMFVHTFAQLYTMHLHFLYKRCTMWIPLLSYLCYNWHLYAYGTVCEYRKWHMAVIRFENNLSSMPMAPMALYRDTIVTSGTFIGI